MTGKRFLLLALIGIGIAGYWFSTRPGRQSSQVNVLLVTFDTTRADRIGCYGYERAATPALDRLARQGVMFERAYATAPLTLPSHATMHTGLLPPEHGLRINGKNELDEQIPTLAEILSKRGYRTAAFVAAFVLDSKFGLDRGFELYEDDLSHAPDADHPLHRARSGEQVVDLTLEWLDEHNREPFFCWVHLYDPHYPYLDHQDRFGDRFADQPYDAEISYADQQLERLSKWLKDEGLEQSTLVIAVGDHGEGLNEHGERTHSNMLYNSTMHVPLIIALPGRFAADRREPAVTSLVDLFPTILDCVSTTVESPASAEAPAAGRSLLPALLGKPLGHAVCYGETEEPYEENGWSPLRSLITDKWKYIRTTKAELYNLEDDPRELVNLASTEQDRIQELEAMLKSLEGKLNVRTAPHVNLSADERRILESLGYVGGETHPENLTSPQVLPDIKEMIGYFDRLSDAQELIHRRDYERAVGILRDIVRDVPNYARAQGLLGVCFAELGDYAAAEKQYRLVLESGRDIESAMLNLGMLARTQKKTDDAIKHFENLLKIHPQSADAHFYLAGIFEDRGRKTKDVEQLKQAETHYATTIRFRPDHLESLVKLTWLLSTYDDEKIRNGARAVQYATAACQLTDSEFPPALDALAAAYAEVGRFDDAVQTMEKCLSIPEISAEPQYVQTLTAHLKAYRAGEPWREK